MQSLIRYKNLLNNLLKNSNNIVHINKKPYLGLFYCIFYINNIIKLKINTKSALVIFFLVVYCSYIKVVILLKSL